MKHLILLLFCAVFLDAEAQPVDANQAHDGKFAPYLGQDFILYTHSNDTLFCDEVKALLKGSELIEVVFTVDGETSNIEGKELQEVQALYSEGKVMMELMPIDPSNPNGLKLHRFKNLSGYFTVWTNNHRQAYWMQKSDGYPPRITTSFALISIEGGPIFNPTENKAKKKILKPLFDECAGIQKTTTDMVAPMAFQVLKMDIVDQCYDYNRLCAPDYGK